MRELVQFVTITTDPERDTPEMMREYGSAHRLDPKAVVDRREIGLHRRAPAESA